MAKDITRRARKLVEEFALRELEVLVPHFELLDRVDARGVPSIPSRNVRQKMLRSLLADLAMGEHQEASHASR